MMAFLYLLLSILSIVLAFYLYNKAQWLKAQRATEFGLSEVYSEGDLFAFRMKVFACESGAVVAGAAAGAFGMLFLIVFFVIQ